MIFKNEHTTFDLCIEAYADEPDDFSDNAIGKNALYCQFSWCIGNDHVERIGTISDYLFQADDIIRLYNGVSDICDESINLYEYADSWNNVTMKLNKNPDMSFGLSVEVYLISEDEHISDIFNLSKEQLDVLKNELFEITKKFPVLE